MTQLLTWYNPIGDSAYVDIKIDSTLRILTSRETDGRTKTSGILRIYRGTRLPNLFHLYSTIHGPGQTDIERTLTAGELRVMFDCARDIDEGNDVDYALRFHATYGKQGHFIRQDSRVSFPCPGSGIDGDPNFCFRIDLTMTNMVDKLTTTGQVR